MNMLQRIFLTGLASALLLAGATSSAQASLLVTSDQGSIILFDAVNNGGSITFSLKSLETVSLINGKPVSGVGASFDPSITIKESRSGTTVIITGNSPSPFHSLFTDASGTAALTYDLRTTTTAITDPNSLSLTGAVMSAGSTAAYDYAPLLGGVMQVSFNGSSFTGAGVHSVTSFLDTKGATWRGGVVFSESAVVPEPSTMVIAGVGALGVIGYGIRRRRPASAPRPPPRRHLSGGTAADKALSLCLRHLGCFPVDSPSSHHLARASARRVRPGGSLTSRSVEGSTSLSLVAELAAWRSRASSTPS
jgi:hypothetical protein